jgi:uncharacterized protein (DUF2141 family)
MKFFIFSVLLFTTNFAFSSEETLEVSVTINNLEKEVGQLLISLANDPTDFLTSKKESTLKAVIPALKNSNTYKFKGLKPGKYAISVFHDENSNGKMDANFIGIPKEPYGVSGKPKFGKPKFDDCSFEVKESKSVVIDLKN